MFDKKRCKTLLLYMLVFLPMSFRELLLDDLPPGSLIVIM